jgi:uncharacterized protein (TIGR02996 family)
MTLERAFLESILEEPEDDAPRLIYSDWLEENGDPDRAEFIRLQIRHTRLDRYSLAWEETQERTKELLAKHRSRWVADLPDWAAPGVEFRRGFPARIRIELDPFLDAADELSRLMPLEGASLSLQNAEAFARLLRHPALGLLRHLRVASFRMLNAESIRWLADSPHLTRLAGLEIPAQTIRDEGVACLARCPLPALRNLDLTATDFGPEGMEALGSASFLGQLTELRLGHNPFGAGHLGVLSACSALEVLELDCAGLTDADMEVLARASLARLRDLDLGENAITAQGLAALARSPALASLAELSLYMNPLEAGAGEALAGTSFRLVSLALSDVGLGDEDLSRFVQSDRLGRLGCLTLSSNNLTLVGARALAGSADLGQLWRLDVSDNPLGSNGALALISAPSLPSLRHLDLDNTGLDALPTESWPVSRPDAGLRCLRVAKNRIAGPLARCLFSRPELARLEDLFVFQNPLGEEGMAAIVSSPSLVGLAWLHASHTALGPAGARALAASTTLCRLRDLVLDDCGLGDDGIEILAGSPVLTTVEQLDLRRNNIGARGVTALAASPHLQRLRSLNLHQNPLGDRGGEALARAVWLEWIASLSLGHCQLGASTARALLAVSPPGLENLRYLGLIGNTPELMAALPALQERFGTRLSLS